MNEKNGFTLVELLVTMIILGIISVLAFPMLRGLKESNDKRKYKAYSDSVLLSAKLYVDSYGEDLFGRRRSGVQCIEYKDLKNKMLLKDIGDNNISCNSSDTVVQVTKLNDVYVYDVRLGCGDKNANNNPLEGNEIKTYYPSNKKMDCSELSTLQYSLNFDPLNHKNYDKRSLSVTISLTSLTGINNNYNELFYKWTKNVDGSAGEWKKLNFDIPSTKKQLNDLKSGIIKKIVVKKDLMIPKQTGSWYLVVEERGIQNAVGDRITIDGENPKIGGPYMIDRTPPTFSVGYENNDSSWAQSKTVEIFNSNDDGKLPEKPYSFDNGKTWESNVKKTYTNNQKITVVVKDLAGNISKKVFTIDKVDRISPVCQVLKSNLNSTNGVTASFKCSDSQSGVARCEPTHNNLKASVSYTISDNAGNKALCKVTVTSKRQYRKRSCNIGKRCSGAGCERYKSCRNSACGVASYNYCRSSGCGWNNCLTRTYDCYAGYVSRYYSNNCKICGQSCWNDTATFKGGRTNSTCSNMCKRRGYTSGYYDESSKFCGCLRKKCACKSCSKSIKSNCAGKRWNCHGGWNSCRIPACGISLYKSCRTSSCGCELYRANISVCGCAAWNAYSGWSDSNKNFCTNSNTCQGQTRIIYY